MQMEIDSKIARVKELIAKREELDAELSELLGGTARERRLSKCSVCGEPVHRTRPKQPKPEARFGGLHSLRAMTANHHPQNPSLRRDPSLVCSLTPAAAR